MKFIHLADLHLGARPDLGYPWSEEREEEIWKSFRRVITQIRNDPVDLLFIAGDLFHRQPLLRELKEVNYLFSTIPETMIFLCAGNHDYVKKDSFYPDFHWEKNVFFFTKEEIERIRVQVGSVPVFVYGLSYHSKEIREQRYRGIAASEDGFRVLLAHGGDEKHIPIDIHNLSAAGFDYIALGHIHKPEILIDHKAAYAGSLEPLDRNETGEHGYIQGSYVDGRVKIQFVPFAVRSYHKLILHVSPETTQYDLEDQVRTAIEHYGEQDIYQFRISGRKGPDTIFIPERFTDLGNVIEVIDTARPAYPLAELEKKYSGTLIGAYIAYFRELEEPTEIEEKALYYGLQALLETIDGNQTITNQKFWKNS